MSKDNDANPPVDLNQDGMAQAPPPSYTTNTTPNNHPSYQPPPGSPSTAGVYQAQPFSGQQTYSPPEGPYRPPTSGTGYPPPEGPYRPPTSSTGYPPPAGAPAGANPSSIVYVIDGNDPMNNQRMREGMPIAMICFIFGICTWLGYLFGMFFLTSKDPRERFWARCCTIGAVIWALVIIFACIFGRPYY